jgi:AGCS family alanine or glycine:cation symporter
MDLLLFFSWINQRVFAMPATFLFLGTAIILTIKTGFLQVRGFSRFLHLIRFGVQQNNDATQRSSGSVISSFHALFAAMGTTIGMGNLVGPTIAIKLGGPSALFWLVLYIILGAVTKLTEVVFALLTRIKTTDGHVIGGPMQYLRAVHPALAWWYATVMSILLMSWSSAQSNTLASIFALEAVPAWATGIALALLTLLVITGGAQRVGSLASKLVPLMCGLYLSFACWIFFKNPIALLAAFKLIFNDLCSPTAIAAGAFGFSTLYAMRHGIYRGIHITESGLGSASIPHAVADVQRPIDQGILAVYSAGADATLSLISGLLILVTGVWMAGDFRSTLIYEAFKLHVPGIGSIVLLVSITLFVLTTVIGNTFNGTQTFGSLTNYRFVKQYVVLTACVIFLGAIMHARLAWEMSDTLLTLVAIPNLIGVLILAFRHPKALRLRTE